MALLIDSRVGSREYLEPISRRLRDDVSLCTLTSGDFAWEGQYADGPIAIGLELKTLGDMLGSMRSGRYQEQIAKMQEDYQICYLMIVGSYSSSEDGLLTTPTRGGWAPLCLQTQEQTRRGRRRQYYTYSELDKFLASVEAVENIVVRKACNRLDATQQILDLYSYWQKPWDSHGSTKIIKLQAGLIAHKASLCRMVAAQIPGIGYEIAGHVDKAFGSVDRMINALPSEWAQVSWRSEKGRNMSIGENKALAICKALRSKG